MNSLNKRTEQIKQTLLAIPPRELQKLEKFISSAPSPLDIPASDLDPEEDAERALLLKSFSKSLPYIEIIEELEQNKDQEPSHSYVLVSHGIYPDTTELYSGTFGKDEILAAVKELQKTTSKENSKENSKHTDLTQSL